MRRCLVATTALLALTGCAGGTEQPEGHPEQAQPTPTAPTTPSTGTRTAILTAPRQAADARDLAEQLITAERATRTARGVALTQAAFTCQVLYRQLARHPGWHDTVLSRSGELEDTVRGHLTARRSLRGVLTTLSDELPAWRVVRPTPLARLQRVYRQAGREHGVPWELLAAINFVETGFGKIRGLSSAGAQGPMQFMPATWAAYGEGDVNDPEDAVNAAARYLAARGGSPFDVRRALWAYNQHTGYVEGVRAYATLLQRDPGALRGLHQWQILYLSARGDIWLPIGYRAPERIRVADYLSRHPARQLGTDTR
ncbi:lytic transglycosylase domain-containing protein [Nocardioides sp.]|uniref:lytic transglycosylase domain-containing protein n=1 Tax=Nocardioides sp. TaxID=35761 RepID=UPI002B691376|nr:lytic transglycosylase domain-containing protein [Nocardioides sp.]HSX66577.1 lytic transglycosylase domain-containing protein [Nocardioides sp.]